MGSRDRGGKRHWLVSGGLWRGGSGGGHCWPCSGRRWGGLDPGTGVLSPSFFPASLQSRPSGQGVQDPKALPGSTGASETSRVRARSRETGNQGPGTGTLAPQTVGLKAQSPGSCFPQSPLCCDQDLFGALPAVSHTLVPPLGLVLCRQQLSPQGAPSLCAPCLCSRGTTGPRMQVANVVKRGFKF